MEIQDPFIRCDHCQEMFPYQNIASHLFACAFDTLIEIPYPQLTIEEASIAKEITLDADRQVAVIRLR